LKKLIEKYALANAFAHGGKAHVGSIIGKLIAEDSSVKSKMNQVMPKIQKIVADVNKLSLSEQEKKLHKVFPEFFEKKDVVEKELKELDGAVKGKVVMRYAPNPNGPPHLGNSRQIVLNKLYTEKYNGKFILRFDDSDPKVKVPMKEAYTWIEDDIKWLGIRISKIVRVSSRLKIYYDYASKLVAKDKAYVCTCKQSKFRTFSKQQRDCGCRNLDQKERFSKFLGGKYKEGQAVLRFKSNMQHKNPAMRDFPLMRIVDKPKHPFSKAKIWPLLNFAGPIDDYLLKVTHIIRGTQLDAIGQRGEMIFEAFGWKHPVVNSSGLFGIDGVTLSTSANKKLIASGKIKGWDDVRLATLMALRRRGIKPESIVRFVKDVGIRRQDATVSMETLYSINRKMLDTECDRYYFVASPVSISVPGVNETVSVRLHPDKAKMKKVYVNSRVYVAKKDFDKYLGKEVRLMHLFNLKLARKTKVNSIANKDIPKLQWVSEGLKAEVLMNDGKTIKGLVEKAVSSLKLGTVVQFERFGFVKLEKKVNGLRFVFAHP